MSYCKYVSSGFSLLSDNYAEYTCLGMYIFYEFRPDHYLINNPFYVNNDFEVS